MQKLKWIFRLGFFLCTLYYFRGIVWVH